MELPEGYTEAPITWSGFDSHAAELAGLTFNGTVEVGIPIRDDVSAQITSGIIN